MNQHNLYKFWIKIFNNDKMAVSWKTVKIWPFYPTHRAKRTLWRGKTHLYYLLSTKHWLLKFWRHKIPKYDKALSLSMCLTNYIENRLIRDVIKPTRKQHTIFESCCQISKQNNRLEHGIAFSKCWNIFYDF